MGGAESLTTLTWRKRFTRRCEPVSVKPRVGLSVEALLIECWDFRNQASDSADMVYR